MEEQILELLNKRNKALSVHEICTELNYTSADDFKKVLVVLNYLEDNLKVRRTNKENYETFKNKNVKIGTLLGTRKNFAFVDFYFIIFLFFYIFRRNHNAENVIFHIHGFDSFFQVGFYLIFVT